MGSSKLGLIAAVLLGLAAEAYLVTWPRVITIDWSADLPDDRSSWCAQFEFRGAALRYHDGFFLHHPRNRADAPSDAIFPSRGDCETDKDPGGECVPFPRASVLTGELRMARMAAAKGAKVWGSEWSPPGSMKTNGSVRDRRGHDR